MNYTNRTEIYINQDYVGYVDRYYNPSYEFYDKEILKIKNKFYRVIKTSTRRLHYTNYSICICQLNLEECKEVKKYQYYDEIKLID